VDQDQMKQSRNAQLSASGLNAHNREHNNDSIFKTKCSLTLPGRSCDLCAVVRGEGGA